MAKPVEFTVTIGPEGQIELDMGGVREASWRRIVELLEETVGPARIVEVAPGEPAQCKVTPTAREEAEDEVRVERR